VSIAAYRVVDTVGFSLIARDERQLFADAWRELGGRAMEIGTFDGCTAAEVCRANPGRELWCVDTFQLFPSCVSNWLANQVDNMRLFVGHSPMLAAVLPKAFFHVALIDGGHSYEACKADLESCLHLVAPDGTILVHDYTAKCFADAIPVACQEVLMPNGWTLENSVGKTACFRREPAI